MEPDPISVESNFFVSGFGGRGVLVRRFHGDGFLRSNVSKGNDMKVRKHERELGEINPLRECEKAALEGTVRGGRIIIGISDLNPCAIR